MSRELREAKLRATDMLLSFGHPLTCNGGRSYALAGHDLEEVELHDHEVILQWNDEDNLVCPECGWVQVLED